MSKEKLIDKINKVLNKARDTNSKEESETAYLLAQKLMAQGGIEEHELDVDDKGNQVDREQIETNKLKKWWMGSLANVIAENFKCKTYTARRNNEHKITFLGQRNDLSVVVNIYKHAVDTVDRLSMRDYHGQRIQAEMRGQRYTKRDYTAYKNTYISGFIKGLNTKLEEQKQNNNWGLVLVTPENVKKEYGGLKLKTSYTNSKRDFGGDAYSKGYNAGNNYSNVSGNITD